VIHIPVNLSRCSLSWAAHTVWHSALCRAAQSPWRQDKFSQVIVTEELPPGNHTTCVALLLSKNVGRSSHENTL